MDTSKFREVFAPEKCPDMIHIVGVGATGSTLAESIARMGLTKMTTNDPDIVEPHNIANQLYRTVDIGKKKVDALEEILMDINPDMEITKVDMYDVDNPPQISGYLFIAVDSIELTKQICLDNTMNPTIKCRCLKPHLSQSVDALPRTVNLEQQNCLHPYVNQSAQ